MNGEALKASEVAKLWGVSRQAVGMWHTRDGCPRNEDGSYALAEVIGWREQRIREETERVATGAGDSPALERMRAAKAEQEELKLKVIKGELIKREDVEKGQVARVMALKRALLALPRVLAPVMVGMDIRELQALLKEKLEEKIREFAGSGKKRR